MPHNKVWTLDNVQHYLYDTPQPACGLMKPHDSHLHEWMDEHFKMYSRGCNGICTWCYRNGLPEEYKTPRKPGTRRQDPLHGNGRHK